MSGLQFTYRFTGPTDQGILSKNRGNNAIVNTQMGMPKNSIHPQVTQCFPMLGKHMLKILAEEHY